MMANSRSMRQSCRVVQRPTSRHCRSNSAGTFVCNHIFYALMDMAAARPSPLRGGFMHVPYAPEQAAGIGGAPSMAVDDIARGIEIVLEVSASRTADVHTAEGRIS
jgi:pyroglutamyl-peptidase